MVEEQNYMRRAIRLAKQGIPWASPNPLVGAVIVKKGRVIGEGCHARCGGMHAERAALEACTEDPAGATVYVTLEPCCHQGRQPPCTQALIESGVAVEMICRELHMSPAYFSTMFRKVTGQTYIAYLTEVRLQKAVELLNETDDKTYVIAQKVGYQEQNYFSYVFKKRFGISPTKYRGTQNG